MPADRVLRLVGPTVEQFAVAVDPLPDDAPVIVMAEVDAVSSDPSSVVDELLDMMEAAVRAQLCAWLPAAEMITGTTDHERRAIRQLAREIASTTAHFGPFLADVAEAALRGRAVVAQHDPEVRSRALARLLGTSYQRDAVALALWSAHSLATQQRHALGTAAQWLANHGPIGIWFLGDDAVEAERFPAVTLPAPAEPVTEPERPAVSFPVLAGRPHPGSAVELAVEAALARCGWARGRAWNHLYQSGPLAPPIRVDLMWPAERVVVELDGPDHRGAVKYADDRRRDNTLTLGGFAVLRIANHEIRDDLSRVLAMIEKLLTTRRKDPR